MVLSSFSPTQGSIALVSAVSCIKNKDNVCRQLWEIMSLPLSVSRTTHACRHQLLWSVLETSTVKPAWSLSSQSGVQQQLHNNVVPVFSTCSGRRQVKLVISSDLGKTQCLTQTTSLTMNTDNIWLPLKYTEQLPSMLEAEGEPKCFPDSSL